MISAAKFNRQRSSIEEKRKSGFLKTEQENYHYIRKEIADAMENGLESVVVLCGISDDFQTIEKFKNDPLLPTPNTIQIILNDLNSLGYWARYERIYTCPTFFWLSEKPSLWSRLTKRWHSP